RPTTSCGMVPSRSGTRIRLFLARSTPLRIASGTSLALPRPNPTRPFWSPATTSALKLKRRPPFTTLATRLMWTTFSLISRPCGSILYATSLPRFSELEPGFAGRVGQRLDSAVIQKPVTIENNRLNSARQAFLGNLLAHRLGGVDTALALDPFGNRLPPGGGRHQGTAA